jgi:hypothetical protein
MSPPFSCPRQLAPASRVEIISNFYVPGFVIQAPIYGTQSGIVLNK